MLAEQIKQFCNIFHGYSRTIDKVTKMIKTKTVKLSKKKGRKFKKLLIDMQVSLNPQEESEYY